MDLKTCIIFQPCKIYVEDEVECDILLKSIEKLDPNISWSMGQKPTEFKPKKLPTVIEIGTSGYVGKKDTLTYTTMQDKEYLKESSDYSVEELGLLKEWREKFGNPVIESWCRAVQKDNEHREKLEKEECKVKFTIIDQNAKKEGKKEFAKVVKVDCIESAIDEVIIIINRPRMILIIKGEFGEETKIITKTYHEPFDAEKGALVLINRMLIEHGYRLVTTSKTQMDKVYAAIVKLDKGYKAYKKVKQRDENGVPYIPST